MRIACAGLLSIILISCVPSSSAAQVNAVQIPRAPDSVFLNIRIRQGWKAQFRCNHDDKELTCVISHLKHGNEERYPELLIDPQNLKSKKWHVGQWWLHSSYNLCEGNGQFNVYTRNGSLQCAKEKHGWSANHFPLGSDDVMTIHVAFSKIGLLPRHPFGFAVDVTDTRSDWNFWPEDAILSSPKTWATAELVQ